MTDHKKPTVVLRTAGGEPRSQDGSTLVLRRSGVTTERISGPRPAAPWGYVVRGDGVALEVLVERRRPSTLHFVSHHPFELVTERVLLGLESIEIKDALLHRRVDPKDQEPGEFYESDCSLVGGPCRCDGLVTAVELRFNQLGRRDGPGWDQPRAFWESLEGLLEGVTNVDLLPVALPVPIGMTDEQRARVERLANWAAEEGDPDVLAMALAVLDEGRLEVLGDVLAIHEVWAKRYSEEA